MQMKGVLKKQVFSTYTYIYKQKDILQFHFFRTNWREMKMKVEHFFEMEIQRNEDSMYERYSTLAISKHNKKTKTLKKKSKFQTKIIDKNKNFFPHYKFEILPSVNKYSFIIKVNEESPVEIKPMKKKFMKTFNVPKY